MQSGDRVHDRYVLKSRLGRGGMADVWRALDERLQREVAVKFLSESFDDPEHLVRFFSEAQQIARVGHPNVVTVLDFGDADGRPFIVMENLEGGSIGDLVGEAMDPPAAIRYVRAAAAGAGAAHDLGIVHRDIKPNNLLLDSDGEIRLADFGIAAHEGGESLTQTGQAIGTPHYISPEQAQGQRATPASDVYALGIVLYELITGTKPFEADNVTAVVLAQVERPPVSPSSLVEDLEPEIEAVIMSCLAKDPDLRFKDGNALAAALDSVLAGNGAPVPLGATVEFATEEEGRRPRGKRIALLAAAATVVGVTLAAVVFSDTTPEGGDVAVAETPADPTPARSDPGNEESPEPGESPSPTPSPSASEDDGPAEADEPGEEDQRPKPSPTPTPDPTPTPTPTPSPTPSPTAAPG